MRIGLDLIGDRFRDTIMSSSWSTKVCASRLSDGYGMAWRAWGFRGLTMAFPAFVYGQWVRVAR